MSSLTVAAVQAWLHDFAGQVQDNVALLTDLDRQIGDADHGTNLERGMHAVAALDDQGSSTAAGYLKTVGMTLVSTIGGASGPLYGTFFLRVAAHLPDDGAISAEQWAIALTAGLHGVVQRGRAEVGDKTMVDALSPALDAFCAAGDDVAAAWAAAARAADRGRDATTAMVARKGRAAYLGERSAGHQDPGATSMALLIGSGARTLA